MKPTTKQLAEWQRWTDAKTDGFMSTQSWGEFPPVGMPQDVLCRSISGVNESDPEFILVAGENCVYDAAFVAVAFEAMPILLAEVVRLSKFEPPVCEECGEYKVDTSSCEFPGNYWDCEEC